LHNNTEQEQKTKDNEHEQRNSKIQLQLYVGTIKKQKYHKKAKSNIHRSRKKPEMVFWLLTITTTQQKKDKKHEKLFLYFDFIFCYPVARVHTRKPPRALDKPLRTRNRIGARYGRGCMR
jgi:hypothetical protein